MGQITPQLFLDKVRELAIARIGEMHAIAFAQHPDFSGQVGPVGGIGTVFISKTCEGIDILEAVEIGALANNLVHHLRLIVGVGSRENWQAHPVDRGILAFDGFHQTIHATGIFGFPLSTANCDKFLAGRAFQGHAIIFADHDNADIHRLAGRCLIEFTHFSFEIAAHHTINTARLFLDVEARVIAKVFEEPVQKSTGKTVTNDSQLVDVALGKRRQETSAGVFVRGKTRPHKNNA